MSQGREAELGRVVDALPVLVSYVGADERYRFASGAYERWFGLEPSAIVGRHLREVLGADGYGAVREHVQRALAGESVSFETELSYADGSSRWIEASYVPQRAPDGTISGFVALVRDISERKLLERSRAAAVEEVAAARVRAEQLYRFAQAVTLADRIEVVFETALTALETALGAERAAILTRDDEGVMRFAAWRRLSPEYRAGIEAHAPWPLDTTTPEPVFVPDAENEPSFAALEPLLRREGIRALAFIPLFTGGRLLGKLTLYYGAPRDFARHELETASAIGNHLASVLARFSAVARLEDALRAHELFAGVLAHDLQNPLGAIINSAQVVALRQEREHPADERDKKPLGRIIASGQRMSRMIEQLLDFTRARVGGGLVVEPQASHLGELCRHALDELELAHPAWRLRYEFTGNLEGRWDPDRLLQVISNLVANAGQHGTPGGEVFVLLDGTHAERVRLDVRNHGSISAHVLPHVFDPFRTTRPNEPRTRGLGLGLFIVRELVRAHGGQVRVSSSETSGTSISVELPRHASPSVSKATAARHQP
jgi:PAS domain S-box-containing protein